MSAYKKVEKGSDMFGKLLDQLRTGVRWSAELSPFGERNGRGDFHGIPLFEVRRLEGCRFERIDFSEANLSDLWIEGCIFENVVLDSANLEGIKDHGNRFVDCSFRHTSFRGAGLGFKGSNFQNCQFVEARFTKTVFNRPEFDSCEFDKCNLKGIDFNASSFVNCRFAGELDGVWFKGGFQTSAEESKYGKPRRNELRGVDFRAASLWGVAFSNHCGFEKVQLPSDGQHVYVADWRSGLRAVENAMVSWPDAVQKQAALFVRVHRVHAGTQDSYILNKADLRKRYGDVADRILEVILP